MQISPPLSFGKSGSPPLPARLMKSDGISTLVMKLRLRQSLPGRKPTRVELDSAPFPDARTTLRRLFFEKGIGTLGQAYGLGRVNQKLSTAADFSAAAAGVAILGQIHFGQASLGFEQAKHPLDFFKTHVANVLFS